MSEKEVKLHRLKLSVEFCDDVVSGDKCFEVRKDDRDYQVGDLIIFRPSVSGIALPGNDEHIYRITYILSWAEFAGISKGYVVLGIKEIKEAKPDEIITYNGSDEKI